MGSLWQFDTNLIPREAEAEPDNSPPGGANTEAGSLEQWKEKDAGDD
jgi:hypothetical protein